MTGADHDTLIVGGGPAGAALGIELAAAGRDVAIVERETEAHHKVCGEFLSFEAVDMLERLGIDLMRLGAVPIRTVGVSRGRWRMGRPLPFRALSLSRKTLDEALLRAAAEKGARLLRGDAAQALKRDGAGWRAQVGAREISAREAVVATGKHDLRGRPRPPGQHDDLIGFKMHFGLPATARERLGGRVEIGLFPGGYAGLEPIEDGRANLCLVISRSAFSALGGRWETLFERVLDRVSGFETALGDAEPLFDRPLAIARIPYGLVRADADGAWLVGDQAAVIPSFAGEGVAIALHSARLAARCMLEGVPAASYQRMLAADLAGQVRLATMFSRAIVRPGIQRLAPLAAPIAAMWLARATRLAPREAPPAPQYSTTPSSA